MKNKILIMTALGLEFDAVKKYLSEINVEVHPSTGSIYNSGKYISGNDVFSVLLVATGAGNVRAADETGRAIDYFKPDYTFFVGIAGGIKDVALGDVVASSKVIGFEVGKDDKEFKPRFDTVQSSYILEQLAKHVQREGKWLEKLVGDKRPNSFVLPIAAGEKVVSSTRATTFDYIKRYCSDAAAVDMEGNGYLLAVRPYHAHGIEIRGISDLIENKEESDASGSQPTAAANASAFTFEMIDALKINNKLEEDISSEKFKKKLVDELVKLYPQGPEQDDIWKRSGGDVSILINSSSRRSQWYNAIEKLSHGGGGKNITIATLINEVKADFPQLINDLF
ncbi:MULTISPECIES: 5'-methylthioadenosine/S-adenosylhomocysteine nucleosidase [Flavobacterium]|uniref:5'-methylthioadenosine/S-adenosylhomocysteine nucleosidase family protein n=1 Tax=Flavobacterium TaxID=237 RepID=UPI00211467E3|nr:MULTISPECIES: 5'-methylthioadenosine/S-adenosylhomocysteine nucleosidase [Flavobacterium]UUF12617.1 5'-methylthioadenosine/S-adenosylhomocysteine nucleosidase [Flavobacterium panici]